MFGNQKPGGFTFNTPSTTGGTGTTGGFTFGSTAQPTAPAAQTAPTGGFSLGGAGGSGGLSFGKTPAPATGFSFGGAATTQASTSGAASGFSFNTSTPSALGAKPNTTPTVTPGGGFTFGGGPPAPTTQPIIGSGLGLGAAPTATVKPTTTAPAAPAATGFSFGSTTTPSTGLALGGVTSTTSASSIAFGQTGALGLKTVPTTTVASTTPSLGFSLSATKTTTSTVPTLTSGLSVTTSKPTTGLTLGIPATTAPATGFSLTTTSTAPATGFNLTGSTTAASISQPSATTSTAVTTSTTSKGKQMTYRQLEDAINKWTTELAEQESIFLQQATQVNAWDRLVMENGEKIIQLSQDVDKVKTDQQKLDHELDFIHSQQRELEDLLEPLEKSLEQLPPISFQQHADLQREHTYELAESIDAQMKRMGQDLKEIIERLNATNNKTDPQDPVQQITKILNAHMDSLLWIDRNTAALSRRVEDISREVDTQRKEQERHSRLIYN